MLTNFIIQWLTKKNKDSKIGFENVWFLISNLSDIRIHVPNLCIIFVSMFNKQKRKKIINITVKSMDFYTLFFCLF